MKLGLIAALPDEMHTIHQILDFSKQEIHGERIYYFGNFDELELVLTCSRVGKVSAASTASSLISKYHVSHIIFTGTAGAVDPNVNIGDIVLADKSYQHDMDATPLFPRFEIPLSNRSLFATDSKLNALSELAIKNFIANISDYVDKNTLANFNIVKPKLYKGTIATGDQFIKDSLHHDNLKLANEIVYAVEMEGAAVGQVCAEHQIPYNLIRTISDKASHDAHLDFPKFLAQVASHYSAGILRELLTLLR